MLQPFQELVWDAEKRDWVVTFWVMERLVWLGQSNDLGSANHYDVDMHFKYFGMCKSKITTTTI